MSKSNLFFSKNGKENEIRMKLNGLLRIYFLTRASEHEGKASLMKKQVAQVGCDD